MKGKNMDTKEKDKKTSEKKTTEKETAAKDNRKYIIGLIAAIVVIAAVVIISVIANGGSGTKKVDKEDPEATEATETVEATEPPFVQLVDEADTYQIDLGFAKLRFPNAYKDTIKIEGVKEYQYSDGFVLKFTAADNGVKLYDLYFNQQKDDILGTLTTDAGYTYIYVESNALDPDDVEHIAMQETINVIISGMINDYEFATNEILTEDFDNSEVFAIETDVVTLYYPTRWQDKVEIKVEGNTVSFKSGDKNIFDLRFEECDGYLLGTYDGTPIYMVEYPVSSDEESAIQQDVNIIIQHLMEDEKFEINA